MTKYSSVLVLGAGGTLGRLLLDILLSHPSSPLVSAITRSPNASFPSGVRTIRSDLSDDSLKLAFEGQDVVVSFIPSRAAEDEKRYIDLAAQAGVKRWVVSHYGLDITNSALLEVAWPLLVKTDVVEHVKTKTARGLTWSALVVGPWFDWGLANGVLGFDLSARTAKLYDGGHTRFSTTTVRTTAQAIAETVLGQHAGTTADRYVFVRSFDVSQREVLEALGRQTGGDWDIGVGFTDELERKATGARQSGNTPHHLCHTDPDAVLDSLVAATFRPGCGGDFGLHKPLDNDLLRLKKEKLEEVIGEVLHDALAGKR